MTKLFDDNGRPTLHFMEQMMGTQSPETVLPKRFATRLGVRVTTDPWPLGDAPINSYHTFAALMLEARPRLSWAYGAFTSDEGSLRQTTAEAVLDREMQRIGVAIMFDTIREYHAEERIDWADAALRRYFLVTA